MPTKNIQRFSPKYLHKYVFAYVLFINIISYDAKHSSKYLLFRKERKKNCKSILYHDDVSIIAHYVMDRVFDFGHIHNG